MIIEKQDELALEQFETLIPQLDAAQESVARSAFLLMRATAKEYNTSIQAMLFARQGSEEVAELQAEAARQKTRADAMDRAGARLWDDVNTARAQTEALQEQTMELQEELEGLRAENVHLHESKFELLEKFNDLQTNVASCEHCELKRRWLAGIGGMASAALYFWIIPHNAGDTLTAVLLWLLPGVTLAASPLLTTIIVWEWRQLKRRTHWGSVTDNDMARQYALKWNRFLERFVVLAGDKG